MQRDCFFHHAPSWAMPAGGWLGPWGLDIYAQEPRKVWVYRVYSSSLTKTISSISSPIVLPATKDSSRFMQIKQKIF